MTAKTRRFSTHELPELIAIFPLEGALLLPRARLPLNIFEPRYLAMIDDALKSDHRLIGMVQPRRTKRDDETNPPIYEVGCAGRITSLSETDDGRYLIALTGVQRFIVNQEVEGFTPFRRVNADWRRFAADLDPEPLSHTEEDLQPFLALLRKYFDAADLSADWEALTKADYETLVNAIAMLCPFSPQEKQALLEAEALEDREHNLRALMSFVVAGPKGAGDLQ
ncbi:MAG: LON peptidase substrate-binding domain-containing protein [Pseudomonadota bacterium]